MQMGLYCLVYRASHASHASYEGHVSQSRPDLQDIRPAGQHSKMIKYVAFLLNNIG